MSENNGLSKTVQMPILPIQEMIIYPFMMLPLFVQDADYIKALEDALSTDDRYIALIAMKQPEEKLSYDNLYETGTLGIVSKMVKVPEEGIQVMVQGVSRIKVLREVQSVPFIKVEVEKVDDIDREAESTEEKALLRTVKFQFEQTHRLGKMVPKEFMQLVQSIDKMGQLADMIATTLDLKLSERQQILETLDVFKRLSLINAFMQKEIEILSMGKRIQSEVQKKLKKNEKEYILREQLKAIHKELGEDDPRQAEFDELEAKISKAGMPEEVLEAVNKEFDRYKRMHPDSSESSILRTYLDWMTDIPWAKKSKDRLNLKKAAKVLDSRHYGLDDIKKRILEFLAVRKLKGDKMKSPILCFAGPPGVGKTSLGQAIAEAMNRKFVRMSLGGIHDEAEIRGHRRTYIGAMPGRIIQLLKQSGTCNPVFMLDEIDKVGRDYRGDPTSALLELLDPEQNHSFADNYLGVPYDLTNVMFIVTANQLDPIPAPLRDRTEVINLSSYTQQEKVQIARKFLIPKQLDANGITKKNLIIEDAPLDSIIESYTREAGVRNLERTIGTVCRKVARRVAEEGKKVKVRIKKPEELVEFLSYPKIHPELKGEKDEVGIATGLAWTETGGDILFIEVTRMKGKGSLVITGQLGDVMQESARAALSFARANAKELGIDPGFYEKMDLHIHVPAGAIPKDGPSAGITMASALVSVLSDTAIKRDIAMTGEITLLGRVLPIGGLKEKSLAAYKAGIKTIIFPEKNKENLVDIPEEVREKIKFIPVSSMEQVLKQVFVKGKVRAKK